MNCIQLAQVRVQWQALVNTVMNVFRFRKESRLYSDKLSNYQVLEEYPAPCSWLGWVLGFGQLVGRSVIKVRSIYINERIQQKNDVPSVEKFFILTE